jgi:hypothetical protein
MVRSDRRLALMAMHEVFADLILFVHVTFVLFIVGGLASIWIGAAYGWRWVRNIWFRVAHLAAILFVAAEAVLGIWCPLTIWEDALRGSTRGDLGFVARWVRRVLYYSFPEWVFTVAYLFFALMVAATWWLVRPESYRRKV